MICPMCHRATEKGPFCENCSRNWRTDEGFDCSRFENGSWVYRLTVTAVLVAVSWAVLVLAIIGLSKVESWIGGSI